MRRVIALAAAALAAGGPALAVGLGPLSLSGIIDGPREGFALQLFNPYPATSVFALHAVGLEDETAQPRVAILPAVAELGPERVRRILVVVDGLEIGEIYRFRVCAQLRNVPQGISINARVCSKLSARRVA